MPSRFASLRPDRPSRLPAALALLLLALLAVQAALIGDVELPSPGPMPDRAVTRATVLPRVALPAEIMRRNIFSPPTILPVGATPAANPLGGMTVAGTMQVGRTAYAMVQHPGAEPRRVAVGGTVAGWTLLALADDAATFARGRQRVRIGYGARVAAVSAGENQR